MNWQRHINLQFPVIEMDTRAVSGAHFFEQVFVFFPAYVVVSQRAAGQQSFDLR